MPPLGMLPPLGIPPDGMEGISPIGISPMGMPPIMRYLAGKSNNDNTRGKK